MNMGGAFLQTKSFGDIVYHRRQKRRKGKTLTTCLNVKWFLEFKKKKKPLYILKRKEIYMKKSFSMHLFYAQFEVWTAYLVGVESKFSIN